MENVLRIAVAGLGTVGASVVKMLQINSNLIAARAGRVIEIVAVSARDKSKKRDCDTSGLLWVDDPLVLPTLSNVDVIVEVIGGSEGISFDLARKSIQNQKSYVTANKALLAVYGEELAKFAEAQGVQLMFEAAVAGGIPIIKTIREALAGNRFLSVRGILNGTCNYILTRMYREKIDFDVALKSAQECGFAEADPTTDIDGFDASHKLALLSSLVFGVSPDLDKIDIQGIRNITPTDIQFADDLGYRIKLLGVAKISGNGIEQRVSPCLVLKNVPLASVEAEQNAVEIEADFVGSLMLTGRGAGAGPTASAVVSDLIDLARGTRGRPFVVPAAQLRQLSNNEIENVKNCYVRLHVKDQPGVVADVSSILRDHHISIESLIQRGRSQDFVPLVIVTHEVCVAQLKAALDVISKLPSVCEKPFWLRIENS